MARDKRTPKGKSKGKGGAKGLREELLARMAACPDAETLNNTVITPFAAALEAVCAERGYVLNIYGAGSNLIVSTEDDAAEIFEMVENYFATQENSK